MIRLFSLLALLITGPAAAQGVVTAQGVGALLRTLDKVSGQVVDVEMAVGQTMAYGTLQVTLRECRYPAANPAGDAFAHLVVIETRGPSQIFEGWMIASSPALMALDHARYDVWALRCVGLPSTSDE